MANPKDTQSRRRSQKLLDRARGRCRNRNRGKVTITVDWIEDKINQGVCEITKIPFNLNPDPKGSQNFFCPSLDRIDNSNPDYSEENTRVVLWVVNRAIGDNDLNGLKHVFKILGQ